MSTTLTSEKTVGQLVAERPARSRVFEKLGIDYCCGGKLSLADACARKKLDAATVLAMLEATEDNVETASHEPDPLSMSLTELCDHIESTHHAYLREELPRLEFMTHKVAKVHGENWPWLIELVGVFDALNEEMTSHMMKEDQVLFPAIRDLEAGKPSQSPFGGRLEGPISMMEHEHESAGRALTRMNELSDGYTPPEGACNTFRAMLDSLAGLEQDMHRHVHKENSILFPKALERFSA
jgi:regulator of cell morphogenesis and NO signaling